MGCRQIVPHTHACTRAYPHTNTNTYTHTSKRTHVHTGHANSNK